jgi:hypothetical protein
LLCVKPNWIIDRKKKRKYYFLCICESWGWFISVSARHWMNYHARRKTEPSQARLFSRLLGFFLHSWRWFFHTTWGFCFAIYVYFYVTRMKIEAMRSHNANIMVSVSLFFSHHLAEKGREENEMRKTASFFSSLSPSLSHLLLLFYSRLMVTTAYLPKKQQQLRDTTVRFFYIIHILLFCLF